MDEIHLSIVAATRNDNHGGDLTYRMQQFVSGFIEQCERHHLSAELILVEWNPPEERPPLVESLEFPEDKQFCKIRIIRVPKEIHDQMDHSKSLPLFQMIAKNVGIRRARGKYILATNIDILFSDELMIYLRDELQPGHCYHADRLDIPEKLPENSSFDEILSFCESHYFRVHNRYGTKIKLDGKWQYISSNIVAESLYKFWVKKFWNLIKNGGKRLSFSYLNHLFKRFKCRVILNTHTNACGDFTLLAKEDWESLLGYPELQGYSWHLDSYLIYQSILQGIEQIELPIDKAVYHIEHGKGSGYTPEEPEALFNRLEKLNIPYLSYNILLDQVEQMKKKKKTGKKISYNDENWGLANLKFEDVTV